MSEVGWIVLDGLEDTRITTSGQASLDRQAWKGASRMKILGLAQERIGPHSGSDILRQS